MLTMSGGLGNQLFQLAGGLYIESFLNRNVLYNVSNLTGPAKSEIGNYTRNLELGELLQQKDLVTSKIPIRLDMPLRLIRRLTYPDSVVIENLIDREIQNYINEKTISIYAYFQDSRLVENVWDNMANFLQSSRTFERFVNIEKIDRIACHLRFGDYADDPVTKSFHGLTKADYFKNSIQELSLEFSSSPDLIVVTDNVYRAKKFITELNLGVSTEFISTNNSIMDLHQISKSSHIVISNSTFAWWGAWFAYKSHEAKVVCPRPWFADSMDPDLPIYVSDWNTVKREFEV